MRARVDRAGRANNARACGALLQPSPHALPSFALPLSTVFTVSLDGVAEGAAAVPAVGEATVGAAEGAAAEPPADTSQEYCRGSRAPAASPASASAPSIARDPRIVHEARAVAFAQPFRARARVLTGYARARARTQAGIPV